MSGMGKLQLKACNAERKTDDDGGRANGMRAIDIVRVEVSSE
jgi:hypothetical protein